MRRMVIRRQDSTHYECHFALAPDHVESIDCWCEPHYFWMADKKGAWVLVIEHEDETPRAHADVIQERTAKEDWVTVLLEGIR